MSIKSSNNSNASQTPDTEKQALASLTQQAILLMIPILFSLIFLAHPVVQVLTGEINKDSLLGLAKGGAIFILPIATYIVIRMYLIKNAGSFLKAFYDLPDSVNLNELVGLRVNGNSPLLLPESAKVKVKNGQLEPQENWLTKIGGPAKLQVEAGNAVYLERGNQFSRVVGQGTSFIDAHERIKNALSIGPQNEDISFKAWTRDGIWVKIKAKGTYILEPSAGTEIKENELYPFYPAETRKAVEETFSNGKEGHQWSKFALGKTTGLLSEYISNRYLEEIFIASANGGQLLSTLTIKDLLEKINGKLQKFGIKLLHLHIKDIELHDLIKAQRIRSWATEQKTFETVTDGEIKAYELRSQKKALADMVHDLVFTLANGLERLESTNLTDELLKSIYEVINQGMKDPHSYYPSSRRTPDGLYPPDINLT